MATKKQLESEFRTDLKKRLEDEFPGGLSIPLDPQRIQGIPDFLFLFEDKWAALETKRAFNSSKRPNQDHYVERMNDMSYSAFVSPENVEEVMHDLQQAFRPSR